MTAQTILPANTLSSGFDVANSLRFNGSSDYLNISNGSSTGRIWSFSCWFKISDPDKGNMNIFNVSSDANNTTYVEVTTKSSGGLDVQIRNGTSGDNGTYLRRTSNAMLRDVSSWYNVIVIFDSTDGTADDRFKVFLNGVRITSFATKTGVVPENYVTQIGTNNAAVDNGRNTSDNHYFDGYMAETVLVDGTAQAATDFGEFDEDTGIWKPINVSGLTYGTNGFYLEFKGSGTSANSSGLGADTSGNDSHFTVNNLTAVDQSTDTCTNNAITLNPLDIVILSTIETFSEGNLQIVSGQGSSSSNGYSFYLGSIGLSTGKWYWEVKCSDTGAASLIGIVDGLLSSKADDLGDAAYGYSYRHSNGNIYNNDGNASYGDSYSTSDLVGVYLDLDNNKLYFAKNGTVQNSGTGKDITAAASTRTGLYFPTVGDTDYSDTSTWQFNFGAGTPLTVSSGNADPNGYGNFEYDPSAGTFDSASKSFYAINTKNLAEFG